MGKLSSSNRMETTKQSLFWALKGVFLPLVVPYMVYACYHFMKRTVLIAQKPLKEKVVLITGASSGLGEALAHVLHKAGCRLILAARREGELLRVKRELMAKKSHSNVHEPHVILLDLADVASIGSKAEEAIRVFGKIDVLINNGGMSYRGLVSETSLDVDMQVMQVNYFGHVALTKAILPHMVEANSGHIVAISSVQGKIAIPFRSAYAASKHALQAFFDTLRAELFDKRIDVCVINPGYIKTNLSLNAVTSSGSKYGLMDPTTAQGMDPEAAASAVMYAIINRDKEVMLSDLSPKLALIIRVLLPNVYFEIMRSRAKKGSKPSGAK